ncbi:probable 2-oxoglutarate-dependent dioxygenase AOP1 [Tanacetum coccineum]
MSSRALPRLPTIDFSNINKQNRDTVLWDSTKNKVLQALQEFGCFEASFNGISPDLRNSVFSSLKELFDLPLETKVRNFTEKLYNGYIGLAKEIPIFESMGIEDPESFSNLLWPNGNDEFSKCIQIYSDKLKELDEIVRTMVLESLNLEKYMNEHMELTSYLTRVMKYRVPQKDEPNAGLLSHADKTLMTILHENGVEGLEVQTKDGEWFKVKLSANTFVVMVGETFKTSAGIEGLVECKASASNLRRIQVKDIVMEVEDHLKTYSSVGMNISCSEQLAELFTKVWAGSFQEWTTTVNTTLGVKYVVVLLMNQLIVLRSTPTPRDQGLLTSNPHNPLKSGFTKRTNLYSNESGPKVVFGDDSLGDIEGYGLVNCNGITLIIINKALHD